jgi:hypothetical protein
MLVPVYLAGCYGWTKPAGSVSPRSILEEKPEIVRVTLRSGEQIELKQVSVVGDSVFGIGRSGADRNQRVKLALDDLTGVELPRLDNAKSLATVPLVVLGLGVVAGLVAVAVACTGSSSSFC